MNIQHPEENRVFPDEVETPDARAPLDTMPAGSFTSSNVHSALYDFGARTLWIRYKRDAADAIYRYQNVPAQVWSTLVEASSKGSTVNRLIAYEFQYAKVGRDDFPDADRMNSQLLRRFVYTP